MHAGILIQNGSPQAKAAGAAGDAAKKRKRKPKGKKWKKPKVPPQLHLSFAPCFLRPVFYAAVCQSCNRVGKDMGRRHQDAAQEILARPSVFAWPWGGGGAGDR